MPGAKLKAPALTDADLANVVWASQKGADFVSLSFVRSPAEVQELKQKIEMKRLKEGA